LNIEKGPDSVILAEDMRQSKFNNLASAYSGSMANYIVLPFPFTHGITLYCFVL
jgi:hypothetical protein